MLVLAYDIGGTKLEVGIFEIYHKEAPDTLEILLADGKRIWLRQGPRKRIATERISGYEQIINKLSQLTESLCEEQSVSINDFQSIGISMPGTVDPQTKVMTIGNTLLLVGKPLITDLCERLKLRIPVFCDNDANLFALAETLAGAGLLYSKETGIPVYRHFSIGVILGSGCGTGIVFSGRINTGRRGGAGEIGHTILYFNGHPCYCGRDGCAEQYLSGPAIEASFSARRYDQVREIFSAKEIFELYHCKEPTATAIISRYKKDLARFLGNIATIFDPDYFVLGGGVSCQDSIYERLTEEIARNSFTKFPIPVFKHQLGDTSGIIGAVLLSQLD